MPIKCFIFFYFLTSLGMTQAQHHHGDRPSIHGMLVFGKGRVYLSHLPMFHSPHDYQVIFEANLDPVSLEIYEETRELNPELTVYTLVPETFVLPELFENPRPFKGQLYLGHFERGGKVISRKVTVGVKRTLHFRKFSPGAGHPPELTYLLFGDDSQLFLAHKIEASPDFDQIIELPENTELQALLRDEEAVEVKGVDISKGRQLYLEFDDLKNL